MHEFRCTCGSSIAVAPPSVYAGYLVWDSDVDASIDKRRGEFRGFLTALRTGQRDAWMRYFYGSTTHDRLHLKTDVDVLEDILSAQDSFTHFCYRCGQCGRLHVQCKSGVDVYNAFRPED